MTWVLMNWKLILLGTALAATMVLSMRLQTVTAQRELAIQDLANYKQAAEAARQTAKDQSDHALMEVRNEIPKLVEQAKSSAWANFKAKYGMGNVACGISTRLPTGNTVHSGETGSATQPDGPSGIQLAIEACARDAGRLDLWRQWAIDNQLKVVD